MQMTTDVIENINNKYGVTATKEDFNTYKNCKTTFKSSSNFVADGISETQSVRTIPISF